MHGFRSVVVSLLVSLPTLAAQDPGAQGAGAQEPGKGLPECLQQVRWLRDAPAATASPKGIVLALFDRLAHLRGDAVWLEDLQRRHREQGVLVAAVWLGDAPADAAKVGAAFAFGSAPPDGLVPLLDESSWPVQTLLLDPTGEVQWRGAIGHGVEDAIGLMLADKLTHGLEWAMLRAQLRGSFEHSENQSAQLRDIVAACPHDGFAWGCLYLSALWFDGDPAAAHAVGKAALQALGDSPGVVVFADLALRGDRYDQELAKAIAMALLPVAAAARDNALAQLTLLRAFVRTGRNREAHRLAQTLPKLLQGQPIELAWFAALLAGAPEPQPFADLAQRAAEQARAAAGDPEAMLPQLHRLLSAADYAVARRCRNDATTAEQVIKRYREGPGFLGLHSDLNNDAWYAVTELDDLAHLEWLALGQAEQLLADDGERISFGNRDTVALVCFLAGDVDRAIEHQAKATEQAGRRAEYVTRLQRFERTKARLQSSPGK